MLLYPDRKRCRKCRSYFGFLIVDRLYCSYACAGVPAPPLWDPNNPLIYPRKCRTAIPPYTDTWKPKQRFDTPEEAEKALLQAPGKEVYHCDFCRHWHIGSPSIDPAASSPAQTTPRLQFASLIEP